jgi:CubicO group peptidase (beta-lactamase class C family)
MGNTDEVSQMTIKKIESLKKFLSEEIINKKISAGCSVMLLKDNKIVLELYEGTSYLNPDTAFPVTSDTLYNLGSTTKPFTSTLIMKLKEDGLLDPHDKVNKFIPEYKFDDVSLLHLMLHTAGYGVETMQELREEVIRFGMPDIKEYLNAIYEIDKRDYPLGTKCMYFSAGYNILLDIIERVTGMSIESFAQKVLFEPLNMEKTTYDIRSIDKKFYACPSSYSDNSEKVLEEWMDYPPFGEGGMISTCPDLLKFGKMILNGGSSEGKTILKEETAHSLLTESTGGRFNHTGVFMSRGSGEAYPTCFSDDYSSRAAGHPGFCGTMFWVEPELNMTAAFLSNSTKVTEDWFGNPGNLVWQIARRLREIAEAAV